MIHHGDTEITEKNSKKSFVISSSPIKNFILSSFSAISVSPWWIFLFPFLFLSGCATAPHSSLPSEDSQTQALLSQAATQFQALNAPKPMNLIDEADVEWCSDKSTNISGRQMRPSRIIPDEPLLP